MGLIIGPAVLVTDAILPTAPVPPAFGPIIDNRDADSTVEQLSVYLGGTWTGSVYVYGTGESYPGLDPYTLPDDAWLPLDKTAKVGPDIVMIFAITPYVRLFGNLDGGAQLRFSLPRRNNGDLEQPTRGPIPRIE
jgi:hypothetical protein